MEGETEIPSIKEKEEIVTFMCLCPECSSWVECEEKGGFCFETLGKSKCMRSISLSRVTLASIDAAAMEILLLSPPDTGMKPVELADANLSLSMLMKSDIIMSGLYFSRETARSKAITFAFVILYLSMSEGLILAMDQQIHEDIIFLKSLCL